jgi:hypothetical protein
MAMSAGKEVEWAGCEVGAAVCRQEGEKEMVILSVKEDGLSGLHKMVMGLSGCLGVVLLALRQGRGDDCRYPEQASGSLSALGMLVVAIGLIVSLPSRSFVPYLTYLTIFELSELSDLGWEKRG